MAKLTQKNPSRSLLTAVWGPGLLATLADTDVGNIVTAAQGGALWGYRFLVLILALIPLLYLVQELTVRLGIFTGRGLGELIRERYGVFWSWCSVFGLAIAAVGSLVTEFTGVAAVGEIYGLHRYVSLSMAAMALFAIVLLGSYRRIERIALMLGLFEVAFFGVAWMAHPDLATIQKHVIDLPITDHGFMYLAAALIGSAFNPWMIYYQQSAIADKRLQPEHYNAEKWDTAIGAILTQLLTAAVLITMAATLGSGASASSLNNIRDVSEALVPFLGESAAHLVFSLGVLGAAMVAAIVSALALGWSFAEAAGYHRAQEKPETESSWFYRIYAVCIIGSATLVGWSHDLIWLDITVQVINAFMLPILIVLLLSFTQTMLPPEQRLNGWYLRTVIGLATIVCCVGIYGGMGGLL